MEADENKKAVLAYVDAFNRGDMDTLRTLFTPDALVYGVLGWGGLDTAIPVWREIHEAFAITLEVEGIIAEGDTVAVRYIERGHRAARFAANRRPGVRLKWWRWNGSCFARG